MLLCLGPWAEGICWFGEQGALVMLGSAVQLNPAGLCSSVQSCRALQFNPAICSSRLELRSASCLGWAISPFWQ